MIKLAIFFNVLLCLSCQDTKTFSNVDRPAPRVSVPVPIDVLKIEHSKQSDLKKHQNQCDKPCQHTKNRINEIRSTMNETILPKTGWIVDRGVKLLSTERAKKVWHDYHSSPDKVDCNIPTLEYTAMNSVSAFFVFETTHFYLFAYNLLRKENRNLSWMICHKNMSHLVLNSDLYETGYDINDPTITGGDSCDASISTLRFRELTKTGPLFLEVLLSRCQDKEDHHELLFHLDEHWLKEVDGSRMDMDYQYHPYQSWRWWYDGEKYTSRSYTWNKNGNASWERRLKKRVDFDDFDRYPMVLVHRKCHYDDHKRAVICADNIKKRSQKLNAYPQYAYHQIKECADAKNICFDKQMREVQELRANGFEITDKHINEIKKALTRFN